jgi:hypothetical protein
VSLLPSAWGWRRGCRCRGALDEVELALLLEYMGVEATDAKLERLFRQADADGSGLIEYPEFRKLWMQLVDAKAELQARGFKVGRWSTGQAILKLLDQALDEEERQKLKAVERARRMQRRRARQRQRRADAAECRALADEELATAIDACGSVFVFGGGARGELLEAPQPLPGGPGGLRVMQLWSERTARGAIARRFREDEDRSGQVDLGRSGGDVVEIDDGTVVKQDKSIRPWDKKKKQVDKALGGGDDVDEEIRKQDQEAARKKRQKRVEESGLVGDAPAAADDDDDDDDSAAKDAAAADGDDDQEEEDDDNDDTDDADEEELPDQAAIAAIVRDYNTPREGFGNRLALLKRARQAKESSAAAAAAAAMLRERRVREARWLWLRSTSPFLRAETRSFRGVRVAQNTAHLWGRRVIRAVCNETVAMCSDVTGSVFVWGGRRETYDMKRAAADASRVASAALVAAKREAALTLAAATAASAGGFIGSTTAGQPRVRGDRPVRSLQEYLGLGPAAVAHRLERSRGFFITGAGAGGTDRTILVARMAHPSASKADELEARGREGWAASGMEAFSSAQAMDKDGMPAQGGGEGGGGTEHIDGWRGREVWGLSGQGNMLGAGASRHTTAPGLPAPRNLAMRSLPPLPDLPRLEWGIPQLTEGVENDDRGMRRVLLDTSIAGQGDPGWARAEMEDIDMVRRSVFGRSQPVHLSHSSPDVLRGARQPTQSAAAMGAYAPLTEAATDDWKLALSPRSASLLCVMDALPRAHVQVPTRQTQLQLVNKYQGPPHGKEEEDAAMRRSERRIEAYISAVRIVAEHLGVWESPPGGVPRSQWARRIVMPRIPLDVVRSFLRLRGLLLDPEGETEVDDLVIGLNRPDGDLEDFDARVAEAAAKADLPSARWKLVQRLALALQVEAMVADPAVDVSESKIDDDSQPLEMPQAKEDATGTSSATAVVPPVDLVEPDPVTSRTTSVHTGRSSARRALHVFDPRRALQVRDLLAECGFGPKQLEALRTMEANTRKQIEIQRVEWYGRSKHDFLGDKTDAGGGVVQWWRKRRLRRAVAESVTAGPPLWKPLIPAFLAAEASIIKEREALEEEEQHERDAAYERWRKAAAAKEELLMSADWVAATNAAIEAEQEGLRYGQLGPEETKRRNVRIVAKLVTVTHEETQQRRYERMATDAAQGALADKALHDQLEKEREDTALAVRSPSGRVDPLAEEGRAHDRRLVLLGGGGQLPTSLTISSGWEGASSLMRVLESRARARVGDWPSEDVEGSVASSREDHDTRPTTAPLKPGMTTIEIRGFTLSGAPRVPGTAAGAFASVAGGGPREASPDAPRALPPRVYALAAGPAHCMVLDVSQGLMTWGDGGRGRCGCGHEGLLPSPTPVAVDPSRVVALSLIAAGSFHSVAVEAGGGALWAWGEAGSGALGLGVVPPGGVVSTRGPGSRDLLTMDSDPAWIRGPGDIVRDEFTGVIVTDSLAHRPIASAARRRAGLPPSRDLPPNTRPASQLAASLGAEPWSHIALQESVFDPTLRPPGSAAFGGRAVKTPVQVVRDSPAVQFQEPPRVPVQRRLGTSTSAKGAVGGLEEEERHAAGAHAPPNYAVLLKPGPRGRAEGARLTSALRGVFVANPTRVPLPPNVFVRSISCGSSHTALADSNGVVWVCGSGAGGRLGLGMGVCPAVVPSLVPVEALYKAGVRVSQVACGAAHTLVATELRELDSLGGGPVLPTAETEAILAGTGMHGHVSGGQVYAAGASWALGDFGGPAFSLVDGIPPVRRVAAGFSHCAVVTAGGELWTWGSDANGCLGHPRREIEQDLMSSADDPLTFVGPTPLADPGDGGLGAGGRQLGERRPRRVDCLYVAPENLALDAPCRQSSTFNERHAFLAVDGVIRGGDEASCTHTQREDEPWWEVDLRDLCSIELVEIFVQHRPPPPTKDSHSAPPSRGRPVGSSHSGRVPQLETEAESNMATDDISRQSVPLFAMLSSEPFPSEIGPGTLLRAREMAVAWKRLSSGRRTVVWTPPPSTHARFCRLQLGRPGGGFLHLAQVRVLGRRTLLPPRMPVVDVTCGRDATIAVTSHRRDPKALEAHYRRAIAADPANAETLRLLPAYTPFFERFGSDYRDEETKAREELARHPPSPRTMRRLRNRELIQLQRHKQAVRMQVAEEEAQDAGRRARGKMAKRAVRRQVGKDALEEANQAATDDVAVWDFPDADGPQEWRGKAVKEARRLLEAEDCMQDPAESGCPVCFNAHKCAACRFHSRWVVPFASREYGRNLAAAQRRDAERVARRRESMAQQANKASVNYDKLLEEFDREMAAMHRERTASERVPAYRQWPLRDVIEIVLSEDREAAGEISDDSDMDEVPRPMRIPVKDAEEKLFSAAKAKSEASES